MRNIGRAFFVLALAGAGVVATGCKEKAVSEETKNPVAVIETSLGTIKVELWPEVAPKTVENFKAYADEEFYNGTIFHRVIPDFMIQGGGFTPDMNQKKTRQPIKNEARADTRNERGTIAMARTPAVDSATSQFFINVKYNDFLDHKGETAQEFGYCVFGKVIDGMDVVDKISGVKTRVVGRNQDVPAEPVVIKSIRVQEKK